MAECRSSEINGLKILHWLNQMLNALMLELNTFEKMAEFNEKVL